MTAFSILEKRLERLPGMFMSEINHSCPRGGQEMIQIGMWLPAFAAQNNSGLNQDRRSNNGEICVLNLLGNGPSAKLAEDHRDNR